MLMSRKWERWEIVCDSKGQGPVSSCNTLGTEEIKQARQRSNMYARTSCVYMCCK